MAETTSKPCEECRWTASAVHRVTDNDGNYIPPVLVGWYCSHCGHFDSAIGRERKLPLEDK